MDKRKRFGELVLDWIDCERCELHKSRNTVSFARGSFDPEIVFIGEAPGADEDAQGRPFVGQAGQLLDELIDESRVCEIPHAIMNILGCRPPENREPTFFEVKDCKKRFDTLLDLLDPQVIVLMGRTAAKKVIGVQSISRWRGASINEELVVLGKIKPYQCVVTYHPSYLLRSGRNGPMRQQLVNDFEKAKASIKTLRVSEDEVF